MQLCNKLHRVPVLYQTSHSLQSVTGQTLAVLGHTEIAIDNAGPVNVFIVDNLPNEMIIGADALVFGKAKLDLPNNKLHWFEKIWSLHLHASHGVAGLDQTFPSTHIPVIDNVLKQFADVFSGPNEPNGFCNTAPLQIITQGEPVYQRPYRAPLTKRQEISKAIDGMLAEGIIRPSSSPWASPVTLVPKKRWVHPFLCRLPKIEFSYKT